MEEIGFQNIYPITIDLDNFFRNAYVSKYYKDHNKNFIRIEELAGEIENSSNNEGIIYVAKSIYDKSLQSEYMAPEYEKCIQVGTALTDERLKDMDYLDSIGNNISEKTDSTVN